MEVQVGVLIGYLFLLEFVGIMLSGINNPTMLNIAEQYYRAVDNFKNNYGQYHGLIRHVFNLMIGLRLISLLLRISFWISILIALYIQRFTLPVCNFLILIDSIYWLLMKIIVKLRLHFYSLYQKQN